MLLLHNLRYTKIESVRENWGKQGTALRQSQRNIVGDQDGTHNKSK